MCFVREVTGITAEINLRLIGRKNYKIKMLQIHNLDNSKSEWNINETHIIIPTIDADNKESDKILTSTLTLNSLEDGDQTIMTNGLEHGLVIGLEKGLFDTPNYKSDLVIIQNSDLKNPVAYTLSYVEQDKSEILWQSPVLKDKICASDKAILEVRDVLNYDMHELERSKQNNLCSLDSDIATQVTKTNGEILTGTVAEGEKESQFVSYYSRPQNGEAVSILPQLDMTKFIESIKLLENKKIHENKFPSDLGIKDSGYYSGNNTQGILLDENEQNVTEGIEINNSLPVKLVDNVEIDKKEKDCKSTKARDENTGGRKDVRVNNLLYEESLPLKKKAKMKRTLLFHSENQKSLLKQDEIATDQVKIKFTKGKKVKQLLPTTSTLQEVQDQWNSDSDEPLINRVTKRKKGKIKTNSKKISPSPVQEEECESNKLASDLPFLEYLPRKIDVCEFNIHKFNSIYDLVDGLRKCRMINATVWQTLHSGLKEMKVDILKEMNTKKDDDCLPESTSYSPQLKAFALVLYFKQPAAFNHLSHLYKAGWPSLNVIKDWKRRINSHQRPNFSRVERSTEA